jgi:hypothetical protein
VTPTVITVGKAPSVSAEGIAEGRVVFDKLECFKCHGPAGRGDGTSAPTLKDDWDAPIRAVGFVLMLVLLVVKPTGLTGIKGYE